MLKEGLCEATTPREQILEVCRFHSTTTGKDEPNNALTTLDAYISRMKEGQENIYYLTGDHIESLRASPQLEGYAKKASKCCC